MSLLISRHILRTTQRLSNNSQQLCSAKITISLSERLRSDYVRPFTGFKISPRSHVQHEYISHPLVYDGEFKCVCLMLNSVNCLSHVTLNFAQKRIDFNFSIKNIHKVSLMCFQMCDPVQ